ncbi:4-hydroxybenzoate solanesyltransferase [Planktothrix tepida]|uniref:4-hydroxybenzoate solanesyltransferase n=2 Tax=Planktothrix TaxID=54304 RepID=A0A1J1LLQ4_9CYAN|nr:MULTISPECIES: 4-hydroxybenzoate solanesyltransferase [Planktothrix]CAD5943723.1 4-hydroxybenzoate solanesyltransferase [Planktothrix tepida]CAD5967513.1 4-hydroxybenzoate solanesyltransferase [Planktothrix pseudagardhii]CUR32938.1 4-hydroxybenzoate octaprenyltransferase [Planktothrix tepida PCC 9214]
MLTQSNLPEPTWQIIIRLLRWDKPAGRLILMIPALWAIVLATNGTPPLALILVIVFGTLATSAAGCVVNDLWDRDIDPEVERTRTRPLASRALTVKTGLVIAGVAFICAAGLAVYLNPLSFGLCVAAVPVIIGYPLAKRVFPIPQLVLSIAWGFAVLISWTAAVGNLETATWFLWAATVLWTLGFDTVYAMSDREDDIRLGVNSSAIFFGEQSANAVGIFFLGTAILLGILGWNLQLHWEYWLTLTASIVIWSKQYWQLRNPDLPRPIYGKIFSDNVGIGFVLLGGMISGLLL